MSHRSPQSSFLTVGGAALFQQDVKDFRSVMIQTGLVMVLMLVVMVLMLVSDWDREPEEPDPES